MFFTGFLFCITLIHYQLFYILQHIIKTILILRDHGYNDTLCQIYQENCDFNDLIIVI